MIELQNIKKTYKSNRQGKCHALNGVSFSLPDRGMVFILGKSGSGKSTLLNVIGGLDSATSGELLVDGNRFSSFTSSEQDNYRNLYVGFIFQDFCLIDGLTVRDNVRLSLDLLGEEDDERVDRILGEVGLSEQHKRYPRELSGGQCQRVAIARALVKSPYLLLADEPTGNLDSKTAKQILELLKALSSDRLVVVVSHNVSDAETYGDRIIEIGDGLVVRDVERNAESDVPLISEKLITLPRGKALNASELAAINEKIAEEGVQITQAEDPFIPAKPPVPTDRKPLRKPKRMRASAYWRLTKLFSKGGAVGSVATVATLTLLALLLCFSHCFAVFDSDALIRDSLKTTDEYSFSLHKGYYNDPLRRNFKTDKTVPVMSWDIDAFYTAGYEGNIYSLYSTTLLYEDKWSESPIETGELEASVIDYISPYAKYGAGVLVTNEEFVSSIYGTDGKLTLLAGKINEEENNKGVLISDYAADSILYYNEKLIEKGDNPYQTIVDNGLITRTNISAVFETGYKERYAELLAQYAAIEQMADTDARNQAITEMVSSDLFTEFTNEVDKYLSIGYYFGDNYQEKILTGTTLTSHPRFHNTDIYGNDKLLTEKVSWIYTSSNKIDPGTAKIGVNTFNKLFGTKYSVNDKNFAPVQITLVGYANEAGEMDEPLYQYPITIVGFLGESEKNSGLRFSPQDYAYLLQFNHYPYAVYLDNADSAASIYDEVVSFGFYTSNLYIKSVYTVKQIVDIFREVFVYVAIGIALVAFLMIVGFSLRSLRRTMREIGILRALGGRTGKIVQCFTWRMTALWLAVVTLSFSALPLLVRSADSALVANMAYFLKNPSIKGLSLLDLTPLSLVTVLAVFLPALLLSLIMPLLFIRRIKPMQIIRKAD